MLSNDWWLATDVSKQTICSIFSCQEYKTLYMGRWMYRNVGNYQSTLRKIPGRRRCDSRIHLLYFSVSSPFLATPSSTPMTCFLKMYVGISYFYQCSKYLIIINGIQPLGRSGQRPEFSQATGMALVRCILGKFLG